MKGFLCLLLFICGPVLAQNTPESLAEEYFEAMRSDGFTSLGRFMHPDALIRFKEMLLPVYEVEAEAGTRQLMNVTFGERANYEELVGLSPEEFMNGVMSLVAYQAGGLTIDFEDLDVLGSVSENEIIHVLTRMTIKAEGLSVTEMEVLSFAPFNGSWRLQLNGEMEGMAQALRASMLGQ